MEPAPAPVPASAAPSTPAPTPSGDPYHAAPRDTVEIPLYRGWQQYSVHCARCHGEDAQGSTFAPSLLVALGPEGNASSRDKFMDILVNGRTEKGMPTAATIGIDSSYLEGLYLYLKGRSDGRYHGGRPAQEER
jgi:mono/diheme cytochrome c family protein